MTGAESQLVASRPEEPLVKKPGLRVCILALSFATNLPAAMVLGAFNFSGSVTVTQNSIAWKSDGGVPDKATIGATGLTGNFSGLGGTSITILDLDRNTEPVGVTSSEQPFISFDAATGFPTLDINFISQVSASNADCSNPNRGSGQACTLGATGASGGSPAVSTNSVWTGTTADSSSATGTLSGVSSDGQQVWSGTWTFNQPFQDVLAAFAGTSGPVTGSYSASVALGNASDVSATAAPEPDTTILLGIGLLAISFGVRRLRKT